MLNPPETGIAVIALQAITTMTADPRLLTLENSLKEKHLRTKNKMPPVMLKKFKKQ